MFKKECTYGDFLKSEEINLSEIEIYNRLLNGNIHKLEEDDIQSSGYVVHTLEASIWCVLTTDNYVDAVIKAVNLGEDTDTTGAVTGGLAAMLYGFETIPQFWITVLPRIESINKLIYNYKKETMEINTEKQEYTITVYTENQVGLLNRIAIIFSRRKINVESLNTSSSEIDGIHRFTIVIHESRSVVIKLVRQIEKQVEVLKAYFNTNDEIVWQELALYKVLSEEITERAKVERLLREFGARAIAIRKDFIVFETTGHREETNKLMKALEPFGLVEFVRSARVAIIKESSGFHEKLKDFENREPSEEVIENEYLGKREAVFTM